MKEASLYVIELEPDKDPNAQWYVGITDDVERRFAEHKSGLGASWTKRNTIVEEYVIGKATRRKSKKMENHLTLFLMQEFGVDSTSGGDYIYSRSWNELDLADVLLPPGVGQLLLKSGSPDLARAARDNIGIRLTIQDPIEFRNIDEAAEWCNDNLAEGTSYQVKVPGWKNRHYYEVGKQAD